MIKHLDPFEGSPNVMTGPALAFPHSAFEPAEGVLR